LIEQGEKIDPDPGLACSDEFRSPVADMQVFERDLHAGEEADSQTPADADFHPQGVRGCRFDPRLASVEVGKKRQGEPDDDKQPDECTGDIGNGFS
jgi:hypothetical protein